MQNLQAVYDKLWQGAEGLVRSNQCELDPLIGSPSDNRRGISLLSYVNDDSYRQQIEHVLQPLKALEPEQYYYPPSARHITVLSLVSCIAGFQLTAETTAQYRQALHSFTTALAPISIHLQGVTLSPACVLLQGFPEANKLNQLRDQLREHFAASGLHLTIDKRYKLSTAHITLVRFTQPLRNPRQFMAQLDRCRDFAVGVHTLAPLDLVFNNWYHNQEFTQLLAQNHLGQPKQV